VGAGLLAKGPCQSPMMSTDTPPSRASPLPQGDACCGGLLDEGHDAASQRLNSGQGFNAITLRIQFRTAALERLLDHDPQTRHSRAGLFDDRDQRLRRLTVGQKVIDDQHAVTAGQVARGDRHGAFGLFGERVNGRRQQVFDQGQGLIRFPNIWSECS